MNRVLYIIILLFFIHPVFASLSEYRMVWEDNFDQPVLNENNWTVEEQRGMNYELQYYKKENISIEKHESGVNCLVLSAKRENYKTHLVTSGRLVTRGKVFFKYGKIEARIKFPKTGNGFWPAFWMLGEDFPVVSSPRCGEIDIVEMGSSTGIARGLQERYLTSACHWGETLTSYATNNTISYGLQDDFHLYTLIWDENSIKMYLDLDRYPLNSPYFEMKIDGPNEPGNPAYYFRKNYGILLNLAVGGTFTGITGNENIDAITALPVDGTPAKMYVDYVRIYQKNDPGEFFSGSRFEPESINPVLLKAEVGAITYNSVELLLQGNDNSGTVYYDIFYGDKKITTNVTSGMLQSCVIAGLESATTYNFSVVARDASGNSSESALSVVATTAPPFSTNQRIDYDNYGYDWNITLFANADCSPGLYSVVQNPDPSDTNYSSHCAKYIVKPDASDWAGVWTTNIGQFTFNADNCKVKLLVNKSVISNFGLKFENEDGTVSVSRKVANKLINQWEELTFDFTSFIGKTVSKIVIIPDFQKERQTGSVNYWDEIAFVDKVVTNNEIGVQTASNIVLYPNPVTDVLQVRSGEQIRRVTIQNLMGQVLKTTIANSKEFEVELQQLTSGEYLVTVELMTGKTSTHKILKK